jgi:hypothetical protein
MFVSVDLPIPGEPPRRTSDPGTRPPPRTRSSSPIAVRRRGARSALTSRSGTGRTAGPRLRAARAPPPLGARSSASVFHSPHDGHWPCHFGVCAPQAEQANTEVGLGTCGA